MDRKTIVSFLTSVHVTCVYILETVKGQSERNAFKQKRHIQPLFKVEMKYIQFNSFNSDRFHN